MASCLLFQGCGQKGPCRGRETAEQNLLLV
ncbi:lipoprotein [Neofamilia massiliensis]